ncbi:MAG: hypothetical protein EBT07_10235 [Actinobacteria bacterium]|nr:hypothetical protein [Actinomycetota bacterium]
MPSLSLNIGLNNGRKLPFGGAAPSGIVVATTNAVNISGNNGVVPDGTYTKVTSMETRVAGSAISDKMFIDTGFVYLKEAGYNDGFVEFAPYGYILIPPNTTFTATYFNPLSPQTFWRAGKVYGLFGDESNDFNFLNPNNNSSTDATIIPTSGWDYAITITSA